MNTFGTRFRLTTFGESHGAALGGVIDGCPAGLAIDAAFIASEMARRHVGDGATTRREPDVVEFLSGLYDSVTLGTPIAFIIRNSDVRSQDYAPLADLCRPGHADYTYEQRYGRRDPRGGGRASARETAVRVAAGAIAKTLLQGRGIAISSRIEANPTPAEGDSSGGIIQCTVTGLPAGIGNPLFDKLNARLAAAMMSIPSAIGFEMGAGFAGAHMPGSEFRDQWCAPEADGIVRTETNHCGGVQGGISNGMPLLFRTAFHAATTLPRPTACLHRDGTLRTVTPTGRHDSNHIPRTAVVVEAMTALTLADLII